MDGIPERMQAMVLRHVGERPELTTVPVAAPGPDEVLVRVGACGVGLTVRDKLKRISADQLPRIPGHEITGRVAALGSNVTGFALDDRVIAYYYLHCGVCRMCRTSRESLCADNPLRIGEHLDGGYAEYVCLPASNLIPVDVGTEMLSDPDLTVACDALGTSLHVVRKMGVGPGTRLLVVGAAGGVGVHLVQLARALGAEVVGVDLGPEKMRVLARLGAEPFDAAEVDWAERLESSIDVAVDLVGDDHSLTEAYRTLAPAATLVRMVTYRPVSLAGIAQQLGAEERSLTGSKYSGRQELVEAVELLIEGTVAPIVGAVRPLEELNELFDLIDRRELVGRAAVTC